MLSRPLPPFRVRPLRETSTLKTFDFERIRDMAEAAPASIKAARKVLKMPKPESASHLKVFGRE